MAKKCLGREQDPVKRVLGTGRIIGFRKMFDLPNGGKLSANPGEEEDRIREALGIPHPSQPVPMSV